MKKSDLRSMCDRLGLKYFDSFSIADYETMIARTLMKRADPPVARADFYREDIGEPMLAFPAAKLPKTYLDKVLSSDSWWAQPKLNGIRMLAIIMPDDPVIYLYGRNRSVKNLIYKNYTGKILLRQGSTYLRRLSFNFSLHKALNLDSYPVILDCEAWTPGYLLNEDGTEARDNNAITAVLTTKDDELRESYQKTTCPITLTAFDVVPRFGSDLNLLDRYELLTQYVAALNIDNICLPEFMSNKGKEQLFKTYVQSGGEGIVLKHVDCRYEPGARNKNCQIKVKRNVSGFSGYEIDAFISDIYNTPEWSKKDLIGGVELSVLDRNQNQIVIAHVTSMPQAIREDITRDPSKYLHSVVVIDGMDISRKNGLITHAKVYWDMGLREDKSPDECILIRSGAAHADHPDSEDYEALEDY